MRELEELQAELVDRWDESHKKSMVTLLILLSLMESPMWSKQLEQRLKHVAGWELSERSLHRTLKRMTSTGLIEYEAVEAAKTGARRKVYAISELGLAFLKQVRESSLSYMDNPKFVDALHLTARF